jgi:DNA end-binding protein Ku
MACHTLHDPTDLSDAGPVWQDIADENPDPSMVALATQLIDRQNGKFQPDDTQDRYEARLREVIKAKLKGEGITPEQPGEPDRGNVIDLMAALKASLGEEKPASTAKKPARKGVSRMAPLSRNRGP